MFLKRRISLILAAVMAFGIFALPLPASARTVSVYVDGVQLNTDVSPELKKDTTMVPLRAILEALSFRVDWNADLQLITADKGADVITFSIGSNELRKNGVILTTSVAPYIKSDRTMVALRSLSESLGAGVYWAGTHGAVLIDSSGNSNPDTMAGSEVLDSIPLGQQIANYACQFVGGKYVYGGKNLQTGVDCSGFVYAVYKEFGYTLTGSSSGLRNYGVEVSYDEMQPGDIICYSGHVSMYIGDGKIVHARNESLGICITDDPAYRTILTIRRIV